MQKQFMKTAGAWHQANFVVIAVFVLGLLGFSVRMVRPESSHAAGSLNPSPLIGVTSSAQNPLQVALLHWYNANLTTQFTTASGPPAQPLTARMSG